MSLFSCYPHPSSFLRTTSCPQPFSSTLLYLHSPSSPTSFTTLLQSFFSSLPLSSAPHRCSRCSLSPPPPQFVMTIKGQNQALWPRGFPLSSSILLSHSPFPRYFIFSLPPLQNTPIFCSLSPFFTMCFNLLPSVAA